jgi:hypothetical protein
MFQRSDQDTKINPLMSLIGDPSSCSNYLVILANFLIIAAGLQVGAHISIRHMLRKQQV